MIIREYDLFEGFDNEIVQELMGATQVENFEAGQAIFRQGDPADAFYVLDKGVIELRVTGIEKSTYVAKSIGETIGWSSVAGRDNYSAGAYCVEDSQVTKFDKRKLDDVLRRHPATGLLFYKRLARAVGERLIECHQALIRLQQWI